MASDNVEDAVGDKNIIDFSCYITINNRSTEDFGLKDFGITGRYGVWPEGMPLNTIDAQTTQEIQLKDPSIYGGSEGWVEYELLTEGNSPSFKLEFACPQSPGSINYLKATTSRPDVFNLSVLPYKKGGHPFDGQVDVKVTGSHSNSTSKSHSMLPLGSSSDNIANVKYAKATNPFKAQYDIGFDGAGPIAFKQPIHETIVIAAFIQSKKPLPTGTTYHNLNDKQWEYFRGIVWNDDPSCYLFDDYSLKNHQFSTGLEWYKDFVSGPPTCMIQRSHYGDLQFLHAMGGKLGESPAETQRKLLKWFEVMYKLACGNQGVSETDQLKQALGEWFTPTSTPPDNKSLRDLILASTPNYNSTNIQWRALGICLHMITDSYAVGHTQRRLRNPDAYAGRDSDNYMVFKPGMWGDWGAVLNFHCYKGQNSDLHSHYDGVEDAPLPVPKNLDSFNSIIGARNAIEGCKKLINFWFAGTQWEGEVKTFLQTDVYAIDPDASPSNSQVDQTGPISFSCRHGAGDKVDVEYQAGLQGKLTLLDARAANTGRNLRWIHRHAVWRVAAFIVPVLLCGLILLALRLRIYGPF
ncbi:hypothetical protein F5Y14DRAFT_466375 [Nemania sp. NC0429]|nr:hypothetical protein F5Y14DRAFT_466375 [Nemania sp. NC0429]